MKHRNGFPVFLALLCAVFCFSCVDDSEQTSESSDEPTLVGTLWNTFYHLVLEEDYTPGADYTLVDADCEPIAEVSEDFFFDLCDEGAGILLDGRLVNNDHICDCAPLCQWGYGFCFEVMDRDQYPWGVGSQNNPVTPLRSWAVDNLRIPFQTVLYAVVWDGIEIPEVNGLGGFTHDGCFRADDADHNRIKGDHYDFYAGTKSMVDLLSEIVLDEADTPVFTGVGKCSYLLP